MMRPVATIVAIALGLLLSTRPASAFDLQGHRGARGLAPENTLPAFQRALDLGVTTIETDLALTGDGVLVIAHDPALNPDLTRGADGHWLTVPGPAIRSLKLDEVRRYDVGRLNPTSKYAAQWPQQTPADGARIPTLAELFDLVRTSGKPVRFNLETKLRPDRPDETADPETFAAAVVTAVRRAGMDERVTIQSFDWRTLLAVKRIAPELATACLTIQTERTNNVQGSDGKASPWTAGLDLAAYGNSVPQLVKAAGCRVWSPFWRILTPALVAEAHSAGLHVLPWTVNDPADMSALIQMKVDGLITDYPDRAQTVLKEQRVTAR